MAKGTWSLVVGTKNWSSWSLRGWLMLKRCGVPFEEKVVQLRRDESAARLAELSPSGKVPVLRHADCVIWDTLAIAEYLAEQFPAKALWPKDPGARARARSVSAEMHSGFMPLRQSMAMDFLARHDAVKPNEETLSDVRRIETLWRECRTTYGEDQPYLFGAWSLADAMYAPVASRFVTYGVGLAADSAAYVNTLMGEPAMKEWAKACAAEAPLLTGA